MSAECLIDLTHVVTDDMPVYPGDPCARLYQIATAEKNGMGDHKIESGMHVGTHIDAPLHALGEGTARIADIPLAHFQGRGHLVDARNKPITAALLDDHSLMAGDIVLIWTGWSDRFRKDDYFSAYPAVEPDFAHAMVKAGVKLVGMDTPSPDYEPFPVHKILLGADVLIAENLTNLAALEGKDFRVHAYPVKYYADAAPVRFVAELI